MNDGAHVVVELPGGAAQDIYCSEITVAEKALLCKDCEGWDDLSPEGFDVPAGSEVHVPHERVVSIVYPDD